MGDDYDEYDDYDDLMNRRGDNKDDEKWPIVGALKIDDHANFNECAVFVKRGGSIDRSECNDHMYSSGILKRYHAETYNSSVNGGLY